MTRTGKAVAGFAIALVAVGATYAAVFVYGQREARIDVQRLIASLPPSVQVRYAHSRFNPLTGTLVLDALAISRDGAPICEIRRARLHEVSGDGSGAHPYRLGALHLEDVVGHDVGGTRARSADAEDLQLLAPAAAGAPAASGAARLYQPAGYPRLTSFRQVELHGLSRQGGTAARLMLTDLAPGRLGGLALDDYRAGNAVLGHLHLGGIALDTLDDVLDPDAPAAATGWTERRPLVDHLDLADLAALPGLALRIGRMSANSLTGHPLAAPASAPASPAQGYLNGATSFRLAGLDMNDASLTFPDGKRMALGSMQVTTSVTATRSTGRSTVRGLALPLTEWLSDSAHDVLVGDLGSDTPVIDVDNEVTTDSAAHRLDVSTLRWGMHAIGTLMFTCQLADFDAGLWQRTPSAAVSEARLQGAMLRFEDAGVVNRWINYASGVAGQSPAQFRAVLHTLTPHVAKLLSDQPDATMVLDRFIDHPKALTLTMNPPAPVTVATAQAADTQQRAGLLGLRVSAD